MSQQDALALLAEARTLIDRAMRLLEPCETEAEVDAEAALERAEAVGRVTKPTPTRTSLQAYLEAWPGRPAAPLFAWWADGYTEAQILYAIARARENGAKGPAYAAAILRGMGDEQPEANDPVAAALAEEAKRGNAR